jgi:crotonobetainyl-CoA:carnitine CoA-transferase CaiB-like acyl-CoA transferase
MQALDSELERSFARLSFERVSALLDQFQVPFSKVYDIEDIKADAHFQSRQMIIRLADPEYGSLPAPCVVPRVVGRAMPVPHTGPAVGEHNAEIYASLGLDTGALAELRAQGVI